MADAMPRTVAAVLSDAALSYPDFPASAKRLPQAWPLLSQKERDALSAACLRLEQAWEGDGAAEAYKAGTALGSTVTSMLQKY